MQKAVGSKKERTKMKIISDARVPCLKKDGRGFLPSAFCLLPSVLLLLTAHCSLLTAAHAQVVVDKTVATVTNGSRAIPDVITYSDLVWQLALEPGTPFTAKPSSNELNRALRLVEDQLLILQEARKLPTADTAKALAERDAEVTKRRNELGQAFGSAARLQE